MWRCSTSPTVAFKCASGDTDAQQENFLFALHHLNACMQQESSCGTGPVSEAGGMSPLATCKRPSGKASWQI